MSAVPRCLLDPFNVANSAQYYRLDCRANLQRFMTDLQKINSNDGITFPGNSGPSPQGVLLRPTRGTALRRSAT